MELIEEVPAHVCKVNDNTGDGYSDSLQMPFHRFFSWISGFI